MTADYVLGADPGLGYGGPHAPRPFLRIVGESATAGEGHLAEEVPVAMVYGNRPHAVMMCTPLDFEDLAVGFSVSEGIVATAADVQGVRISQHSRGVELRIAVPEAAHARLAARARGLPGRTGCGLCGVEAIDEVVRTIPVVHATLQTDAASLQRASEALFDQQTVHQATRAAHAAAWVPGNGGSVVVREDVGRHNAVDKLLGALWRGGVEPSRGFVVVTSRLSYELVQKVAVAGVPLIAAGSRPTGLAIRLAERAGITVAVVGRDAVDVYTHPERLIADRPPADR